MAIGANFDYTKLTGASARATQSSNGHAGTAVNMRLNHLHWIHAVHVVGTKNYYVVWIFVINQIQALINRISTSSEPSRTKALLGWYRSHVVAKQCRHTPGLGDVTIE